MYYSSRNITLIKEWHLTLNKNDDEDAKFMQTNDTKKLNHDLARLKKCFTMNPLTPLSKEDKEVLFKTREHYHSYP